MINLTPFIFPLLVGLSFGAFAADAEESTDDPRVQILDINDVKAASYVGTLRVVKNRFNKDTVISCSAILIAEEYLMTAAHCIFDHLTENPALNVEFIPQYLGTQKLQRRSRVFVEEGWIHKQYVEKDHKNVLQFPNGSVLLNRETTNSDVAILKVVDEKTGQGLGKAYGFLAPIAVGGALNGKAADVSILSYPGDKEHQSLWHERCSMKSASHLIGTIFCRLYSGASGSGVIVHRKGQPDSVAGIVSTSILGGLRGQAVLFSDEMLLDVKNITSGKSASVKTFKQVTFLTEKAAYVNIENRCDKDIIAQIYFQPEGQDDWGVIERTIPVGASSGFGAVNSRTWYSHIRGLDGTPYNLGRDISLSVEGKRYTFKKRTVPFRDNTGKIFYGDHFQVIYCI